MNKHPLSSMTVRGIIVMLIPVVLRLLGTFGVELPGEFEATLLQAIENITYLVGAVMAYVGRKRAKAPLKPMLGTGDGS